MKKPLLIAAASLLCLASVPGLTAASIYVSNQTSGQVNYYNLATGTFQGTVGTYGSPTGLSVDSAGSLFIAAFGEDKVYKVNTTTGAQTTFATLTSGSGVFEAAFDATGNVYITSSNTGLISKYNSVGTFIGSVSVPRVRGLSFNPITGTFFAVATPFSDLGVGTTDLLLQVTTGLTASTFATTHLNLPRYTLIDSTGNVIVSNGAAAGTVEAFASTGVFITTVESGINGANEIAAIGGAFPIYVAASFTNTVLKCAGIGSCASFINQGAGSGTNGVTIANTITPEPASLSLVGLSLVGLAALRRRKA